MYPKTVEVGRVALKVINFWRDHLGFAFGTPPSKMMFQRLSSFLQCFWGDVLVFQGVWHGKFPGSLPKDPARRLLIAGIGMATRLEGAFMSCCRVSIFEENEGRWDTRKMLPWIRLKLENIRFTLQTSEVLANWRVNSLNKWTGVFGASSFPYLKTGKT